MSGLPDVVAPAALRPVRAQPAAPAMPIAVPSSCGHCSRSPKRALKSTMKIGDAPWNREAMGTVVKLSARTNSVMLLVQPMVHTTSQPQSAGWVSDCRVARDRSAYAAIGSIRSAASHRRHAIFSTGDSTCCSTVNSP
eukprot:6474598-Prymnesium_polylepis.1